MAFVPGLIPLGFSMFKMYENSKPDARQANSHEVRKDAIVDRFCSGHNPRIAQMTHKAFEKFVRINSIGQHGEEVFRLTRKNHLGQ